MKQLLFILFIATFTTVHGLRCYVCSKSSADISDVCVTMNATGGGVPTVPCSARFCTIKRQEYVSPAGTIASFYRGCENNPVHQNTMVEDEDFKTYFRACTTDLCNIGNGIQNVNNLGQGGNLVLHIPGLGHPSSAFSINPNSMMFLITSMALVLINAQNLL